MQQGGRRIWPVALGAALLATLSAGVAVAAAGSLIFVQQQKDGVGGVEGIDQPLGVATSPDGRHAYVTGGTDDAVATFARDPGTSALSFVGFLQNGLGGMTVLDEPEGVAVAPDGRNVYVAAFGGDAVVVFSRSPTSGELSFVEQHTDGVGGVDGLSGAEGVSVSPDGRNVYVAGNNDNAVAVFSRDPATGALTFVEQQKDGVGGVDGLGGAAYVAPSPDGRSVYVTGLDDDAVAVFSREPATGALTFVEQQKDGVGGVDGLLGAFGVASSPDARNVYVVGFDDDAVAVFSRDPATGGLTFVEQQKDGVGGVDGLLGAVLIAVSPDGANVYVTGRDDFAVVTFSRDPATGALAFVEQDKDGVDGVDGLASAFGLDAACDGRSVYATGFADDAVAAFSREGGAPGTCAPDLEFTASKQKIDKAVEAVATCGLEACTVEVTGKLKGVRKKPALRPATAEIDFDEDQALSLGLGRRARRKARKARKEGEKVFAKMTATATDLAGNDALPETVKIKLK
jgi:DNA-binding beta-propeller fold protein YncE